MKFLKKKEKNLDLQKDPKLHWALKNRSFFPVNLQTADRFALLRVPGLGIQSVDKVLKIRRYKKIRLKDLEYLRISLKKVKYFVQVADYNPDIFKIDQIDLESRILNPSKQLNLFDSNSLLIRKDFSISAAWGEL